MFYSEIPFFYFSPYIRLIFLVAFVAKWQNRHFTRVVQHSPKPPYLFVRQWF